MGLADLNTYSEEQIVFTDNRDATVLFLSPVAADLEFTATGTSFSVNNPYNIDEIIRPDDCLPTFSVDVSGLSGTTVAWATIPAGSTVTVSNGVYTIDNIVDAATYDIVKTPTITVPSSFQGSFFYNVSVNYTTSAGLQTYEWQVGVQVPVSIMDIGSSMSCVAQRLRSTGAALPVVAGVVQTQYLAQFINRFNLDVITQNLNFMSATGLSAQTAMDLFQPFSNLSNKTYQSNVSNLIFDSETPYVRDPNPGSSTFEVTFTVSDGVLSVNNGVSTNSTVSISGTMNNVNNLLSDVIYYPDYNQTNTVNLTYSIEKDNVLLDSGFVTIAHTTEGTLQTQVYTFTSADTLDATYEQIEYGQWEYLVVGGGGGGAAGGGGGGGQVLQGSYGALNHGSSYAVTVGSSGSRGNYSFSTIASWSQNAGQGGNSTALGYTAYGGFGGRSSATSPGSSTTTWNFNGGDTRKTNNTSQAGGFGAPVPVYVSSKNEQTYSIGAGGGGAGAGQAGTNAVLLGYHDDDTDIPEYGGGDGGDGVVSSISGSYYGGGGGGGAGFFGLDTLAELGQGGAGGGGRAGGVSHNELAENGSDNYGGGGGAGTNDWVDGPDTWKAPGRGGSGVVILRVTPKT